MSMRSTYHSTKKGFKNGSSHFNEVSLKNQNYFDKIEVQNVETQIFLDRLTEVFEELMTKLEFAISLPDLLSNQKILEILETDDLKQIFEAFVPFSQFQIESKENSRILEAVCSKNGDPLTQLACGCKPSKSMESAEFSQKHMSINNALQILTSYELVWKLSRQCKRNISKNFLNFLRQIKYFMEFVISEIALLSEENREKELHLRKMCKGIKRSKKEISELTAFLQAQKARHSTRLTELSEQLRNCDQMWKNINEEYHNQLTNISKESENNSAKSLEEFIERMENYQTIVENSKQQAADEKLLSNKMDTDIQGKKFKAESQLLSLIMKYDTEIGDRQRFYEGLMQEYNVYLKEKSELMEKMEEQLQVYNAIIREREETEFANFRDKYYKFVNNRCARIIQRWWRKILSKRKKKSKKGKKKRK